MEWLNEVPVNLNGGFISLALLLCSTAVISWVLMWLGSWENEEMGEEESSPKEVVADQRLMEQMTKITLEEALLQTEPDRPLFQPVVDPESPGRLPVNGRTQEERTEPLLNPLISSCSFRKPSTEMVAILRPLAGTSHAPLLSKETQLQPEPA